MTSFDAASALIESSPRLGAQSKIEIVEHALLHASHLLGHLLNGTSHQIGHLQGAHMRAMGQIQQLTLSKG